MEQDMIQAWKSLDKDSRSMLRGAWGEYHLNAQLNQELSAIRFETNPNGNTFLFPQIEIPSYFIRKTQEQKYTEIDSLLVCQRSIFSFEVKSWSGSAGLFGERNGKQWFQVNAGGKHGGNTTGNPFGQNNHHLKYLANFTKGIAPVGAVLLVDADPFSIKEVKWQGEDIGDLFLNVGDLVNWVKRFPVTISGNKVREIAKTLNNVKNRY
ncbi:MAG: NERD domain-containing protein [Proteobacteria bacterium]|nr:NERD domain-containing protein [Pseudomonadota bacterium]